MDRFYKGDVCKRCSKPLTVKNKSGFCRSCRMLGNQITLGRKMSESQRTKLSKMRKAENNPNWKGDNVGISALHSWVKPRLPKSQLCDSCGIVPPMDLANKGTYNRNLKNWEWLCRKCHMKSDGRLERLTQWAGLK